MILDPSNSDINQQKEISEIQDRFKNVYTKLNLLIKHRNQQTKQPVKLIAVSKYQPIYKIKAALDIGHRVFGENQLQEALRKWTHLKEQYSDIELHFIGKIQTNKLKHIVRFFDVIHSVDRIKILKPLAEEMKKTQKFPILYVQVNTGKEHQKNGVFPDEIDRFLEEMKTEYGLIPKGLMVLPPIEENPKTHFLKLQTIAKRNKLSHLSMGMSADYETAVLTGSTEIRLGSILFGSRKTE